MQTLEGSQIRVREDREDTDTQPERSQSSRGRPGSNQGVKVGLCFAIAIPISVQVSQVFWAILCALAASWGYGLIVTKVLIK